MQKLPFVDYEKLKEITAQYPTPFHLYDEAGIRRTAREVYEAFSWNKGFREYYAIKACPNPFILKLLKEEGYDGFLMDFRRVDGFTLRGVTLRNPTTFGFRGERLSNFVVDDVTFDYETFNPVRACMDGIHFDGGSHHGRITNLRGACWDDLLAFNSNDTDHTDAEGEPISDIVVDGVFSVGCHSAVRLLSTGGDVRNITIRNIHGTFYRYDTLDEANMNHLKATLNKVLKK